jgi:hypothetical protein
MKWSAVAAQRIASGIGVCCEQIAAAAAENAE